MKKRIVQNKVFIIFVACILTLSLLFPCFAFIKTGKDNGITIVIDAGHGGRDGGSVGSNGTIEKEINLTYALSLANKLKDAGYRIVLTRKTDDGLYDPFAKNKKISDMNKRMEIIKNANPNLVVSIHMNSFKNESASGAVTYHKIDDSASIDCGNIIQQSLHTYCGAKSTTSKGGDFFMLNCSYYTSVLVECGFISNEKEEQMLNSSAYQEKIVSAIASGIGLYFGSL